MTRVSLATERKSEVGSPGLVLQLHRHQGPGSFCLAALPGSVSPHVQVVSRNGEGRMLLLSPLVTSRVPLHWCEGSWDDERDAVLSEVGAVSAEEGVSSEGSQEGSATAFPLPLSPRGVLGQNRQNCWTIKFFLILWMHWIRVWFSTRSNFTLWGTYDNVWRWFWLSQLWSGYLHLVGGDQGCYSASFSVQDGPQWQNLQAL